MTEISTELFDAIDQQDEERMVTLLSQGTDPNMLLAEPPHWRPLEAAIEEIGWYDGSIRLVQILLEAGADPNTWDSDHGITPLHAAMRLNIKEAIRLLLEAGADPNLVSEEGESALRWAVEQGDLEMAQLFLRHGADKTINEIGGFCGYTVLTLAARKLNVDMIELLLAGGADPEAVDEDGKTACKRLPPREEADPDAWNRAMNLLASHRL